MRAALVALLAAVPSCLDPWPANVCESSAECTLEAGGECAAGPSGTSWCTYAASDCATGRRWSSLAGDGLAGQCLGPPPPTFTLTVALQGAGTGTVRSDPPGIECGGTCAASFTMGTTVTLTATPTGDSSFLGWTGDCAGLEGCTVVMDAAKSATAEFRRPGESIWIKQIAAPLSDVPVGVAVDRDGNIVVAGAYAADLVVGGMRVDSRAGDYDIYVVKLSRVDGSPIWLVTYGGDAIDNPRGMAVDNEGNVYVVGEPEGDFSIEGTDLQVGAMAFVLKLSGADGGPVWAKGLATYPESATALGVAVDQSNNVLVTGSFASTVVMDGQTLTSAGAGDVYAIKLASSDGHRLWARQFGGTGDDHGFRLTTDADDNVLLVGVFEGTVNNLEYLSSAGGKDVFVAKMGPANNLLWAIGLGGMGLDEPFGVTTDSTNAVTITGRFSGTGSFGGVPLVSYGPSDIFVAKYSTASAYVRSEAFGGDLDDRGRALGTGSLDTIVVVGEYAHMADFGDGAGASVSDALDGFVASYASDGTIRWSRRFGSIGADAAGNVAADGTGVAVAGWFDDFCDFGDAALTPRGGTDGFVWLLAP